ncbi:MAG: ABC transporter permease subunit [Proteobacteria bacterium]|nr:ABC transporter permease subunit [Pseudomonadota bacterium]
MKDSILLFKKEMIAIFRDKRLILTITLIPFIFIPAIFYFNGIGQGTKPIKNFIIAYNEKVPFVSFLQQYNFQTVKIIDKSNALKFDAWDVFIYSSKEDTLLKIYVNAAKSSSGGIIKTMERYYLSFRGVYIRDQLKSMKIPINKVIPQTVKIVRINENKNSIVSFLLPFFILIYLFSNAIGVGLDSIAGEKERNTLQLLLVNRISRESILFGKLFSTMTVSLTGAIFSILGLLVLYVFKIIPNAGSTLLNVTPANFTLFAVIIITLDMLVVSILIIISSYSRTVKEGQGYILPVYFIILILGMAVMNPDSSIVSNFANWPFINSLLSMQNILNGDIHVGYIIWTIASNILFTIIILKAATVLFNRESVIFRK